MNLVRFPVEESALEHRHIKPRAKKCDDHRVVRDNVRKLPEIIAVHERLKLDAIIEPNHRDRIAARATISFDVQVHAAIAKLGKGSPCFGHSELALEVLVSLIVQGALTLSDF